MEENFDEILERGCLFDSPIRNKNRIRVRRKKSDSDFHLSIVNDMMFQIMMNNRSRFQFPCMLISLVFQIPYKTLLEEAEFYKEFIDREKLDSKGFICDCMIIYRDTIFNIEMNGSHTLARNQDYIHKAATIKNRRGKKIFKLMNYCQINLNNFNIVGHDDRIETYKPLNHDGYLYGYQILVNFKSK